LKIIKNIDNFPILKYAVVSIGRFDGVHLGHQKLLKTGKQAALSNGGKLVVVTFDPGPEEVLFNKSTGDIKLLNTLEEKARLLAEFGVDYLIVIPFTKDFSHTSSTEFVKNILVKKLNAKEVVMGFENQYGYGRDGDFILMNKLAEKYGFKVSEVPMEDVYKLGVSSVRIRKYLKDGNIPAANKFLGYKYCLSGEIIYGNRIGHKIGFPTANLDVKDKYRNKLMPPGVYVVEVEVEEKNYFGMANIGYRPTLGYAKHELTAEVHIFKFNQDIYGTILNMFFLEKLRDEHKFIDLDHLKIQLRQDKKSAMDQLKKLNLIK
jgi:riboflavin kinase/FMN adenylyltransferase